MSNYAISLRRSTALLAALALTALLLVVNFASFFSEAEAAQLSDRSLTLSSTLDGTHTSGTAGTETNGSAATHEFEFTTTGAATSATFTYCTDAVGTCTAPTGLVIPASPTVGTGGGTAAAASNVITWTATINAATTTTVSFQGITNPTYNASPTNPDDNTFFVRIQTIAAGPTNVDDGTVASAITEGIVITSRVAETLGFSTTGELLVGGAGVVDPGANCAALEGSGAITIGDPTANTLAINNTFDNYTGFRIYTNAANATLVQYEGDTLRRGGSVDIDPIGASALASAQGDEQFGLAADLVSGGTTTDVDIASSNTDVDLEFFQTGNPATGVVDGGAGAGGITIEAAYRDGAGTISTGGTASFAFVGDADSAIAPQTIAQGSGYIDCASVAVRYMANIDPITPAGTYTTTIVYSAVPTY